MKESGWSSILGHTEQGGRLRRMLQENRLPHAILLAGPRGVGKRRTAEVLAAAVLCMQSEPVPCGHCESCRAAGNGTHPDLHIVQPESSGKGSSVIRIEQIRMMQTEVSRKPLLSGRHVVLIDDADLMNEAAENSLLKILEEPAGGTLFLLVTSARASLLDTIQSRCMPVVFGLLEPVDIRDILRQKGIPEEQVQDLAVLAGGSPGHAVLLAESGGLELREQVTELLERLDKMPLEQIFLQGKLLGDMSKGRLAEWLGFFAVLLRDLLVLRVDGGSGLLIQPDIRQRMLEMIELYPERRLFSMLQLLHETQRRLSANVNLRLLMESFLIRCRKTES